MSKRPRPGSAVSNKFPPAKRGTAAAQKAVKAPLANQPVSKRRVMAPEKKNLDFDGTQNGGGDVAVSLAGTWTAPSAATFVSPLVQGTSATTRLGRKVAWIKWHCHYTATLQAGGSPSTGGGQIRCRLVFDKQTNAAAPAVLDIFQTNDFHSANNLSNEDRFITVADWLTEPISVNNNFSVSGVVTRNLDLESIFNTGNAGTVADVQSGSFYLLFCLPFATITTTSPIMNFYSRFRFVDY